MYKVDYYTVARCGNGSVGNIIQYSDVWYTDLEIEKMPEELQRVIDIRKGANKYVPRIVTITYIKGHLNR